MSRSIEEIQKDIITLIRVPSLFIDRKLNELADEVGDIYKQGREDAIDEVLNLEKHIYRTYEHGEIERQNAILESDIMKLKRKLISLNQDPLFLNGCKGKKKDAQCVDFTPIKEKGKNNMTKKEFADKLNGREYAGYHQFTTSEVETAKENGWFIVYGASDDLIEFDGAIYDEDGCHGGGNIYFDKDGVGKDKANCIEARWCEEIDGRHVCWSYETDIPHETFKIMEDGEVYCIGMIISVNDLF